MFFKTSSSCYDEAAVDCCRHCHDIVVNVVDTICHVLQVEMKHVGYFPDKLVAFQVHLVPCYPKMYVGCAAVAKLTGAECEGADESKHWSVQVLLRLHRVESGMRVERVPLG